MTNLRLAIQKSGRLHEQSVQLLRECGLEIDTYKNRLRSPARNFPVELLFLRDDDIPRYVADKVVDAGIVGENLIHEHGQGTKTLEKLGFAHCRLSLAVPKESDINSIQDLNGKRIATSYPKSLEAYAKENQISVDPHKIRGSVENRSKHGTS